MLPNISTREREERERKKAFVLFAFQMNRFAKDQKEMMGLEHCLILLLSFLP